MKLKRNWPKLLSKKIKPSFDAIKDISARNSIEKWMSRNKKIVRKLRNGLSIPNQAASRVASQEIEPCLKCGKHAYKAERVEIERGISTIEFGIPIFSPLWPW